MFCASLLLTQAHLASIKEVEYARSHLGAIGTGIFSNHEGKYLGNPEFTPFFAYLQSRETPFEIVFIHSSSPLLNINGTFISGNPSRRSYLIPTLSPLEATIPVLTKMKLSIRMPTLSSSSKQRVQSWISQRPKRFKTLPRSATRSLQQEAHFQALKIGFLSLITQHLRLLQRRHIVKGNFGISGIPTDTISD